MHERSARGRLSIAIRPRVVKILSLPLYPQISRDAAGLNAVPLAFAREARKNRKHKQNSENVMWRERQRVFAERFALLHSAAL